MVLEKLLTRRELLKRGIYSVVGLTLGLASCATDNSTDDDKDEDENKQDNQNYLPEIISEPVTVVDENQPYLYQVIATDPDKTSLEYFLVRNPEWRSIEPATGEITGVAPSVNEGTTYPVTVGVFDGHEGGFAFQDYNLLVRNVI